MSMYDLNEDSKGAVDRQIDDLLPEEALSKLRGKIEKFHTDFSEDLWSAVEWDLKDNMKGRIAEEITRQAGHYVERLLHGDEKTLQEFNLMLGVPGFNNYIPGEWDGEGVRRKLVSDHQDFLENQVLKDLEKEVASLTEALKWARDYH